MSNDENKEHYLKAELYRLVQQDPSIFEFIQNGSLDGIWYWDIENPEQEWLSPRFKAIFGYEDHEIPNTAAWWQENIFPEDLVVAIDNFNPHCADPNHPYDQIVRYRHKDGSTVWIRCRGLAIRDANGKALRMLGAHTNVTALKEAEGLRLESLERLVKERTRELQKSETQFKTLLESAPDGVVVCDESGKIVLVNDETERLFGYKRDELIGLSVEMLVPDVHRKRHAEERTAYQSEPIRRLMSQRTDLFAKRKNGTVFPAEISLSPTTIADQTLVMALVRDVTDIRAVFDSILRFSTLVDTSPDAIFSSGLDGTIKSWNKGAESLFGYSEKEAIGMPLARLAPPVRLHEQASMLEAISQGHPPKHLDTVRVRKDGALVPVSIISFPIKDSLGSPIEMAGVVRDLTDQKKLEAQFQHAQRMEAIGSLAGGVAHDFNNVLTTIKGYGSLLQDKLPSPSQEQEMIASSVKSVGDIGFR